MSCTSRSQILLHFRFYFTPGSLLSKREMCTCLGDLALYPTSSPDSKMMILMMMMMMMMS